MKEYRLNIIGNCLRMECGEVEIEIKIKIFIDI